MWKKYGLIGLYGLLVIQSAGAAPVNGAFGVLLGKAPPVDDTVTAYFLDTSGSVFEFQPLDANPSLSTYVFYTTPLTDLVYKIEGYTRFFEFKTCEQERRLINQQLKRQFGRQRNLTRATGNIYASTRFGKGKQKAISSCTGFSGDSKLSLVVVDEALERQAKHERHTAELN